jgi:uncharacterized membrane protein
VQTVGSRLGRLTMYWLLMQVITPFATRVLTGDGAFQVRFIFYACVQTIAGVVFLLMIRNIRKYGRLRPGTPPTLLSEVSRRTIRLAAAFLVSIPLSVFGSVAYACWVVIPLGGGLFDRLRRRSAAVPVD